MTIAEKIMELRKTNHLTQTQLAAKLGCAGTMVSGWERGIVTPNDSYKKKLASAFNVEFDYFIENEEDKRERMENLRTKEATRESVPALLKYKTRNGDILELPDTPEAHELFERLVLKMMADIK